jgi:hypothetical protein
MIQCHTENILITYKYVVNIFHTDQPDPKLDILPHSRKLSE